MKKWIGFLLGLVMLTFSGLPAMAEEVEGWGEEYVETVSFSRVENDSYDLESPAYFPCLSDSDTSLSGGTCAPVAGANIISYYDRWYQNLNPDYEGRITSQGGYTYTFGSNFAPLIDALYEDMGTNTNGLPGTSVLQFKRGLLNYVREHGQSCGYRTVMQNENLVCDAMMDYVEDHKPIAGFFSKYNLGFVREKSNVYEYHCYRFEDNHAMVIFGYRIIRYYQYMNGMEYLYRTDCLLRVSNGYTDLGYDYVLLDSNTVIDDAFAVDIY